MRNRNRLGDIFAELAGSPSVKKISKEKFVEFFPSVKKVSMRALDAIHWVSGPDSIGEALWNPDVLAAFPLLVGIGFNPRNGLSKDPSPVLTRIGLPALTDV